MVRVVGPSGIEFEVGETVASGMVASGLVKPVSVEKPKAPRKKTEKPKE